MRHVARVYTFAALRDVYWREGQGEIGTRKEGSTHSAPGMFRETDSHFKGRAGAFLGEGERGERERGRELVAAAASLERPPCLCALKERASRVEVPVEDEEEERGTGQVQGDFGGLRF